MKSSKLAAANLEQHIEPMQLFLEKELSPSDPIVENPSITKPDDSSLERDDAPSMRPLHKMSVPTVSTPPHSAGRSRLSSFNLPLFSATPKSIFSGHKRRESLGKALQKKLSIGRTGPANESVVIDIDDQEKATETLVVDGLENLESTNESIDFIPLQREIETDRRVSQSSSALGDQQPTLETGPLGSGPRSTSSDDAANFQRTERNLLTLLDEFNAGNLKAFGGSNAAMALRRVREMQERLARSHFEMYALQEKIGFDNPKLATLSFSNWQSLMGGMQDLCEAVHRLNSSRPTPMPDPLPIPNELQASDAT